jgi:hypothetical protein
MPSGSTKVTTDHDEIRRWAEARGAQPARVKRTGARNDPGLIRLDFPGYRGEETLEPTSWEEWFKAFDAHHLAFVYQEKSADGKRSNFNKLVSREAVEQGRKEKAQVTRGRRWRERGRPQ